MTFSSILQGVLLSIIMSGCSMENTRDEIRDPRQALNRRIMAVNTALDKTIFSPFHALFQFLPSWIKKSAHNVLDLAESPISIINSLLLKDPELCMQHIGRFFVNATFGMGGLIDVASDLGITPAKQDFGKTLQKVWGVGPGSFSISPLFGPSNTRDSFGRIIDFLAVPLTYWSCTSFIYYPLSFLLLKSSYGETERTMQATFDDPYVIIRSAYYEMRGDLKTDDTEESSLEK